MIHSPYPISSVQSLSLVDSLRPHESQHARPPCPSPTPGFYSNSCPSSCDAIQPSHPLSSPSPSAPNHKSWEKVYENSRQKLPFHRASLASPVLLGDMELSSLTVSNFELRKPQSFKENQKCSALFQMALSQRAKSISFA